ncbi:hypothetical protein NC653_025495 [Populus alba x Populus x berolinensis]|uniref:Uncharacterized protein n=1 Tax=Populus alba x Populus x berolinensis TaxID=444605 RepID=A0AAD6MBD6_9ROSI|nr:hypothetical protein NC653_025495 [Populus alba x Populus x berolinensis]
MICELWHAIRSPFKWLFVECTVAGCFCLLVVFVAKLLSVLLSLQEDVAKEASFRMDVYKFCPQWTLFNFGFSTSSPCLLFNSAQLSKLSIRSVSIYSCWLQFTAKDPQREYLSESFHKGKYCNFAVDGHNDILYPKEDKKQKILLYACRSCDHQEVAGNNRVYRNEIYHYAEYTQALQVWLQTTLCLGLNLFVVLYAAMGKLYSYRRVRNRDCKTVRKSISRTVEKSGRISIP